MKRPSQPSGRVLSFNQNVFTGPKRSGTDTSPAISDFSASHILVVRLARAEVRRRVQKCSYASSFMASLPTCSQLDWAETPEAGEKEPPHHHTDDGQISRASREAFMTLCKKEAIFLVRGAA